MNSDWVFVNQKLIAKALQELSYEQVIAPVLLSENTYSLKLHSGVVYTFKAWLGIWTDLKVEPGTILRNGVRPESSGQFFIDLQGEMGVDDIILGNFIEEMNNSLYADCRILGLNRNTPVSELVSWSGEQVQSILWGHPKLLISKGRLGWSAADQDQFAPENRSPLKLHWLAVQKKQATFSISAGVESIKLLEESFNPAELLRFKEHLDTWNISNQDFHFVPVHPWQWQRFIKIQYASMLAHQELVYLGEFGDLYLPQISLRTFSNISRPEKMDIKIPITILNTSSFRGIPEKYISEAPALSNSFADLCAQDALLSKSGTQVLKEFAGISVKHPQFQQIDGAPYRYQEMLGAIWRQSTQALINSSQKAVIAGSLMHRDLKGKSLLAAYAQASGLSLTSWLTAYFRSVILPLYHLQLKYGIGLVAHGQNVVVRMTDFIPDGLFLKDFQGDLRLTTDSTALTQSLTRLPAHYLIHDLVTGHFVTVLRYLSESLQESENFSEKDFYQILGHVLKQYLEVHPELVSVKNFSAMDLLQKTFPRVLVNRVRFKIGYADSAERPVPLLGDDLLNPIFLSLVDSSTNEALS